MLDILPLGNTDYIIVKKSNIALYVSGLGIIGTDVISDGIPLPDGLKLTDNIAIFEDNTVSTPSYWLLKSDNINNYFEFSNLKVHCKTEASSNAYYSFYRLEYGSFVFYDNRLETSISSGSHKFVYSFNDVEIDGTMKDYAHKNFFDMEYEEGEYIFPYIADTDEVLSNLDNTEKILIFPGNVAKENLPLTFSLLDVTNNMEICSISLDTNSPYYLYILENPDDFWFEIPTSEFKDYLVNGNQYSFNIIARNNVNEFTISRSITYGGTTVTPPTEEDKQTDAIINQTEKIEEQTNAIVNQTEKIEEQTEVQKNIFERIGDILSYINPLSENFFAYKLVDLLIDALKSLFVPEERIF